MPLFPALERIIKRKERVHSLSLILRFLESESPFCAEVEVKVSGWLLCFSYLQVEHPEVLLIMLEIPSKTLRDLSQTEENNLFLTSDYEI